MCRLQSSQQILSDKSNNTKIKTVWKNRNIYLLVLAFYFLSQLREVKNIFNTLNNRNERKYLARGQIKLFDFFTLHSPPNFSVCV